MSKIYVDEIAGIASADTVAIPGHVIQVVQNAYTSTTSVTSTTYTDTGVTASITPKSSSSVVYIFSSMPYRINGNFDCSFKFLAQINGGGYSQLKEFTRVPGWLDNTAGTLVHVIEHTHGTTSQIDYKYQFKIDGGTPGTFRINNNTPSECTLTVMEIAG